MNVQRKSDSAKNQEKKWLWLWRLVARPPPVAWSSLWWQPLSAPLLHQAWLWTWMRARVVGGSMALAG
jgi:hypothetical protein